MSKHTKGPWLKKQWDVTWINNHKHHYIPIVSKDTGIAVVVMPHEDDTPELRRERKATASLIAASPTMLADHEMNLVELNFLLKAILADDPKEQLVLRLRDIIKRTETSIAKADGVKP